MSHGCQLYLLRHGATASNVARPPILQGRGVNFGLSSAGREQAARTAAFLAGRSIQAVYCSPLLRAQETAAAVAAPHGLPIHLVEALCEIDVGRWEGRSWADIAQAEPEAHRAFLADCGAHGYAGGENFSQVQERVAPALESLLATHFGQSIVVVGHNGVNRAYLAYVLGLPLAHCRAIIQDNCGVNVLEYTSGETRLVTLNATFHLHD